MLRLQQTGFFIISENQYLFIFFFLGGGYVKQTTT